MPSTPSSRRLVCSAVIALVALGPVSGSAVAAYRPPPPVKAKCSISTIVERRVAVSCFAGKARAGANCSLRVKRTTVARGKVNKNGRYFARFVVKSLLTRGTTIVFLVQGKTAATLRV